jgi:hypothetical protein
MFFCAGRPGLLGRDVAEREKIEKATAEYQDYESYEHWNLQCKFNS